ncbi:MAG: hypothetical protein AAFU55_00695 [Pseudomonadota bacterium]
MMKLPSVPGSAAERTSIAAPSLYKALAAEAIIFASAVAVIVLMS